MEEQSQHTLSKPDNSSEDQPEKVNFIYLKWFKRIIAFFGILIGLIVFLLVIVAYLYEDEIKQYAVQQLNKKLDVKVSVEDIDFTVFEQFPQASLKFHNTFINDKNSSNPKDTLLFAENIYFNFNFWSIIEGNYIVKNIKAENSFIHLNVNKNGIENYAILKEDTLQNQKKEEKFSFALKHVLFEDLRVDYFNDYNYQYYSVNTDRLKFSGDFSSSVYQLTANSNLKVDLAKVNEINYLTDKNVVISLDMTVNNDSSYISFNKGDFSVENAEFFIDGKIINDSLSTASNVDLKVSTNSMSFDELISLLPNEATSKLKDYDAKGNIQLDGVIKGKLSKTASPGVLADFSIIRGSMIEKNTKEKLSNISLKGVFKALNNSEKSTLYLEEIYAELAEGKLSGKLTIEDIQKGIVQLNVKGEVGLNKLLRFLNSENIESASGELIVNSALAFQNFKDEIEIIKTDGAVAIQNGELKFNSAPFPIKNINGIAKFNKNNISLSNLDFTIYEDEFITNFTLTNFADYFSKHRGILKLNGTVSNNHLNLGKLLVTNKVENEFSSATRQPGFLLPDNIIANIFYNTKTLTFGKFTAKNVKGKLLYKNQKVVLDNTIFNANKGAYNLSSSIEQLTNKRSETNYIWNASIKANSVDFSDLFSEFDNFSQSYVTDKNIKGKGNVEIEYSSLLNTDFSIIDSTIVSIMDISIDKGVLLNQSTLLELGEYLNSNKVINKIIDTDALEKKLKQVKFQTLQNTIKIEKNQIIIPRMLIHTNVMDLELLGKHSFDDIIDYHFNFRLRDVMVQNKKEEEFGPIKDDGLGVKFFVHVFGNIDNLKYELDKEERKLSRKENIEQEKKNVKQVLKEEFGLFKKDTSLPEKNQSTKPQPEFEVSWDEFDEDTTTVENSSIDKSNKNKEKEKKKSKWLEKLGVKEENKKETQFQIENE